MIQIESNIPYKRKGATHQGYPFKDMNVGDSFLVPLGGKKEYSVRPNLYTAAKMFCVNNNLKWKFKTAAEQNGIRIWRVK